MMSTTAPPTVWEGADLPADARPISSIPAFSAELADANHVERIKSGEDAWNPDPTARRRMASLLQSMTGWDIFPELEPDRLYVSRLWAEDWDSPEDSAYDE